MKYVAGIFLFFWLLSGFIGAWWLDDLDSTHWKVIARGPFTLVRAYNENSPTYPGPN